MSAQTQGELIAKLGWRQGALLGPKLTEHALQCVPANITASADDYLIVTSHDCDITNPDLLKEPTIEILRATCGESTDSRRKWGRNPRVLQIEASFKEDHGDTLVCSVHERWTIPRDRLLLEPPLATLAGKERRLIAEWLAKRYIRAAFPTAFNQRWSTKAKAWESLLRESGEWIQGVYLRLSTLKEISATEPYRCHLLVAVPASRTSSPQWTQKRSDLEKLVQLFWSQFSPHIEFDGVDVLGTDEITLADIETYQRVDADWISVEDETPMIPPAADMRS